MNIRIMRKKRETATNAEDTTDGVGIPSSSILVLDDMREIIGIVARFARMEGFGIIQADTVAEAFQQIRDPDVFASLRMAFLDIEVGSDLGFEVYNAIRAKSSSLPVIMMSGSSYHRVLYPILAYDNCASFMPKPFDMATIRQLMREPLSWGGDMTKLFQSDPNFGRVALSCAG